MHKLLNVKNEHLRFSTASNILDRISYKPSEKLNLETKLVVIIDVC